MTIVPGSFALGLAVGGAVVAVAATALDARRRKTTAAALGALEEGLSTLEQDGGLDYGHMHQVGALRELAAGVRRGLAPQKEGAADAWDHA